MYYFPSSTQLSRRPVSHPPIQTHSVIQPISISVSLTQFSFRIIYLFMYYFFPFTQLPRRPVIHPPIQTHIESVSQSVSQLASQSVNSLIHVATPSVTMSLSYFPRFSFSHYVDKSRYARCIRNELFTFPIVSQRCNALRNYARRRGTDCNLLTTSSF